MAFSSVAPAPYRIAQELAFRTLTERVREAAAVA
jgi:hypothetical protein